jgi:phasin family protein
MFVCAAQKLIDRNFPFSYKILLRRGFVPQTSAPGFAAQLLPIIVGTGVYRIMTSAKSKAIKEGESVIETSEDTDTNQSDTATTVIEASDEAIRKATDATLLAVNEGVEKAAKGIEAGHAKLTEILKKTVKNSEELLAFNQGNLEAVIKSTQIYSAGFQDVSKQLSASGKASFDESLAFTKSLVGAKSGKEALELQSGFIKASIESAATERKKIIDAITKLTDQAFSPLGTRFTLALETFGKTH